MRDMAGFFYGIEKPVSTRTGKKKMNVPSLVFGAMSMAKKGGANAGDSRRALRVCRVNHHLRPEDVDFSAGRDPAGRLFVDPQRVIRLTPWRAVPTHPHRLPHSVLKHHRFLLARVPPAHLSFPAS